jgi:pimeloyl-ACP methyl ester carboxylesterase
MRKRLLARMPVSERRLGLGEVATAVLEGGEGRPIVLLHGPGEHAAKWLRTIPTLVRSGRVIAPDLPGHGASAPVEGEVTVPGMLAWLDDLIGCTCASRPVVVGLTLGGAIAARFAAARPGRLAGLVLVDALGLAPFQPAPEFGAAMGEFLGQPDEATHDRLWTYCAADLDAMRRELGDAWEELRAYNLEVASDPALHGTQQGLMASFGFPAIDAAELAAIETPTTLIWGRQDLATPVSVAEAASRAYGWPLDVIEGAGDDPALEKPAEFLAALNAARTR